MDETSRGAELEQAVPAGHLAGDSPRRLRRHRRTIGVAILSAAVVLQAAVIVSVVLALTSAAVHKLSKPEPAAAAAVPPEGGTGYVTTSAQTVVPISLATNTAGAPIKIPESGMTGGFVTSPAVASPDGRSIYEVGMTGENAAGVTPINTATNRAGPTITLKENGGWVSGIAIAPNGKTAYLSLYNEVLPINTATNTAGKALKIWCSRCWPAAFTPNGKTLYVVNPFGDLHAPGKVTPIRAATNSALAPIELPGAEKVPGYLFSMAITPSGKTAYVLDGVQEGKPYANRVLPISLATNTALAPIAIEAPGSALDLVMAPGGRTAYVLTGRAVTPIDTATNQAEPAINLPETAGYADYMAITPNGKTIYVLTPRGIIPVRTATRTVLPMITVPKLRSFMPLAITPDSRTVYAGTDTGVIPISTATNTPGRAINLRAAPVAITFAR
jgi:hypothetical protein